MTMSMELSNKAAETLSSGNTAETASSGDVSGIASALSNDKDNTPTATSGDIDDSMTASSNVAGVKDNLDSSPADVAAEAIQIEPGDSSEEYFKSAIAPVDDKTIEKLTYGLLAHFLPSLQKGQSSLQSLVENQRILIETVQQENEKFSECQALKQVTETMEKARRYHSKLVNIRREMMFLHDKSAKLKKRAVRLQQQKQKEALQQEQERERRLERERQLIAKPTAKIQRNQ